MRKPGIAAQQLAAKITTRVSKMLKLTDEQSKKVFEEVLKLVGRT